MIQLTQTHQFFITTRVIIVGQLDIVWVNWWLLMIIVHDIVDVVVIVAIVVTVTIIT